MSTLRVRAADLQVGDVCRGSGALVTRAPTRGARTSTGHVDLSVRYPNRKHPQDTWRRTWRSGTMIGINREEPM